MSLKGFGPFVIIADPPQEDRIKDLFLPSHCESPDRGVVQDVGLEVPNLTPGMMIHYVPDTAILIADAKAVHMNNIVAYEED